jgi:hypothetical protein
MKKKISSLIKRFFLPVKISKITSLIFGILVLCFAIGFYIYAAWNEPSANPPLGNVEAPINISGIAQTKAGDLTVAQITSLRSDNCNGGILNLIDSSNNTNWHFTNRRPGCGGNNDFQLFFYNGSVWSGPHLTVEPNGNVGIGTTSPWYKLQVVGDVGIGGRQFVGGRLYLGNSDWHGWGTSIIDGRVWSANNNIHLSPPGGAAVYINSDYRDAGGGTGSVNLYVSGTAYANGQALCQANGVNCPGGSGLWVASGSNIYNTNTGNVGIGTTSPTSGNLQLANNYSIFTTMSDNDYWKIYSEGGSNSGKLVIETGDDASEPIVFRQRMTYNPYTTRDAMYIDGSGNVGIGTTSPANYIGWPGALEVVGQIKAARYYDDASDGSGSNTDWRLDLNTTSYMNSLNARKYNLCYQIQCAGGPSGGTWGSVSPEYHLGDWTDAAFCGASDLTKVKFRIYVCD